MKELFLLTTLILALASPSLATTRHLDNQLSVPCSGNYNYAARDCTGSDGDAFPPNTGGAAVISPTVAGDVIVIRGGTYNIQLDFQVGNKTGTASAPITVKGASGETAVLQYSVCSAYGMIKARGNRGYFVFEDLTLDGINMGVTGECEAGWAIRDSNHHFTLRRLIIKNQPYVGLYIGAGATDILVEDSVFHDARSNCVPGYRHYGWYIHDGARITMRRNTIYNMPGGGAQIYPGPLTDVFISENDIHDNTWCASSPVGGVLVGNDSTGGVVTNVRVYNNKIYKNGVASALGPGGSGGGIRVGGGTPFSISGIHLYNNTIYANEAGPVGTSARGITIQSGTQAGAVTAKNNLVLANETTQILDAGSGNTFSNNITTGVITDYTISTTDLNLKQGANSAVDAGTSVPTRLSWVGSAPDVGATERGQIVSAVSTGGFIEVTVSVGAGTSGVLPTSGITAFTITNGTSTGTPVVSSATIKPGSSNIVLLTTTGFSGSGSCSISYGAGNMTDSGFIGPAAGTSLGTAQPVNSAGPVTVSGTCDNSAGGTPPATNIEISYLLTDGSGDTAADAIAANDGTLVGGVHSWLSPAGLQWGAVGSTYSPLQIPHGSGIDPKTTGLTLCGTYTVAAGSSNVIVGGASVIGTSQRFYFGSATGQTWQLGVYNTSYVSVGESEFPVTPTETRVCIGADDANDLAVLVVNGVKGTSAATSRSTASMTTIPADLTVHCVINAVYCGAGLIAKDIKVWSKFLTQQEFTDDYLTYFPLGASVGGYAQTTHRWQAVYLDNSETPIPVNFKTVGAQEIEVVAGGAVAVEFEVECSGGACGPMAARLYASDIAGNTGAVPQELDAFGLALWRVDTSSILNGGVATCCLTEGGTAVHGVTILDSVATNTIELCDGCKTMFRFIVRIAADQADEVFSLFLKQDNGAELDGAAGTTPQIRVVAPRVGAGF